MPLSSVYDKLMYLKKEPSKNKKVALLKQFLEDNKFTAVVDMALSHDKVYHIRSFGPYLPGQGGSYKEIMKFLIYLIKKGSANKADRFELQKLASSNPETYYVVNCIVKKDLRCGVGAALVNQAVPDTVFIVPYMRCMGEKEGLKRIHFPAFCQKKADGGFAYGFIDKETNKPYIMSRNGLPIELHGEFDADIELLRENDEIITMELTAVDENGRDLPRKISNGIINKAIQGTITKKEAAMVRGQAWDILPQEEFWEEFYEAPYETRWRRVSCITRKMNKIRRIQSRRVKSIEEARSFFKKMRKEGFEGAILKNTDGPWKSHTSPNQCKLKPHHTAEFILTGWYYGEPGKKYEKCLGGLSFESSDGLVKCNTGSGFDDKERGFLGFDKEGLPVIDKTVLDTWGQLVEERAIISVEFDSLITDKNRPDIYSLFLPIFDKTRPDKNEADDLEYLKKLTGYKE